MSTCHGGAGQPLDRDSAQLGQDTGIPNDYHHEDIDNLENLKQEHCINLKTLTQDLDDLHPRVQAGKGQPMEAINCIENELHKSSAPPKPLDDVLQQYTGTLCSAQKQTPFMNMLVQDILTFNSSDSMQLEHWLVDIETTANLTDESRTILAQAKSKG